MAKYVVKRVIMALVTILVVACVTFLLMMSVPGSPFNDEKITPEQKEQMNEKYGLNEPLVIQMANYLKNAVQGDLDVSLKMQKDRPVLDIIVEKFPLSAQIGVIALVWAVLVGVPLGCLAAYNRGKWIDSLLRVICTLGISMPGFVVANFLLLIFCNDKSVLSNLLGIQAIFNPEQGVRAYLMPCLALGLYPMCYIARLTRSSMLDALGQDYIKTARAKGLATPGIIFKHALRNGVIPVITYLGPLTAFTLCGGFVVETVYTIPGLGRYFIQSVQNRDYFIIMGTTIFLATLVIVMNLVVDILYKIVDPRIDLAKGD